MMGGVAASPAARAADVGPPPVIHLDARSPAARLQQSQTGAWADVCAVPCLLAVPPDATYRISGYGVRASAPFTLLKRSGDVDIEAKTVSQSTQVAGVALDIVGGALLLFGGLTYRESFTYENPQSTDGTLPGRASRRKLGLGSLGVGALFLGIGIPLSLTRTTVVQR